MVATTNILKPVFAWLGSYLHLGVKQKNKLHLSFMYKFFAIPQFIVQHSNNISKYRTLINPDD